MKVWTYLITQPDGKLSSICGAVFETQTAAEDALFGLYDFAYTLQWMGSYYKMISRGGSKKHRFNAHVFSFEYINN